MLEPRRLASGESEGLTWENNCCDAGKGSNWGCAYVSEEGPAATLRETRKGKGRDLDLSVDLRGHVLRYVEKS